ncbi:uncharacterized protein EDB93DRAFT_1332111 [Suillus bovinus]|uniref:uncharacterized protein n=1 Tax=Suillus bovinus TaxID=48563 RepID=UPI001B85B4F0|nr:uncharacterized protein EDB93DRAFT_1332111 [Suillus bovinus]KAG2130194.1 hypothetical protein EDB93DRAFT_1332111 [Suillus bovinus]
MSKGERADLNSHVIFRRPADGQMSIGRIREILISHGTSSTVDHVALQVFSFRPTLHPSIFLPCLDLTEDETVSTAMDIICTVNLQHNCIDSKSIQTKPVVDHQPTPYFFLNAYSIHNCDLIQLVIPEALRESPLRVANPAEVRTLAIQQMKDKKAAKKSGSIPEPQEGVTVVEESVCNATVPLPAFDRAPAKKIAAKPRKSTSGTSTRGRRKMTSSNVGQPIAGTSRQMSPSSQQGLTVPSHQFMPPPLQASHYPLPLPIGPLLHAPHHPQAPFPPSMSYSNTGPQGAHAASIVHPTHTASFLSSQPPLATHQPHTSPAHFMQAELPGLQPRTAHAQMYPNHQQQAWMAQAHVQAIHTCMQSQAQHPHYFMDHSMYPQ